MAEILFYHLLRQPLEAVLPSLLERSLARGWRAVVHAPSAERLQALDDHLWTIAVARILLGPGWHVQAPPNLAFDDFPRLLDAGIDDWGGVSPLTPDFVNPEAPWPDITRATARAGSMNMRSPAAAQP